MNTNAQHTILAAMPIPAIILSPSHQIIAANSMARKLFGTDLVGVDFVNIFQQTGAQKCLKKASKAQKLKTETIVLKLQTSRSYRISAAPLGGGETASILFTLSDISEQLAASKARSTFVANVSHELRSPLTSLIGVVETLQGPARNDAKARERFLDLMQSEAKRMSRLVGDLLSLSKLEAKEHLRPKEKVDIHRVIQTVQQSLCASKPEYKSRIEITKDSPLCPVIGDQDDLTEVFQNLLENALKYSTLGTPVLVNLSQKSGPKNRILVRIDDIGEGIAAKHIPHLTERFYRVDKGRSRKIGGTGLGLAITKHILNRHRAKMTIKSKLGKGTSVRIQLKT